MFEAEGPANAARARLAPFARAVNATLDACGFPLCEGGIMARNQKWCLSAAEWRVRFGEWIRNPDPEALLNADIFFDFRALWGKGELADDLRAWLSAVAADAQGFLRMMARNALESRPPLGFFGGVRRAARVPRRGRSISKHRQRASSPTRPDFCACRGCGRAEHRARLHHAGAMRKVPTEETEAVADASTSCCCCACGTGT